MQRFCRGAKVRPPPLLASLLCGSRRMVLVDFTQSYTRLWYAEKGHLTTCVTFGGSFCSTSSTRRRSMKGSRIWCSLVTTITLRSRSSHDVSSSSSPSPPPPPLGFSYALNQSSKARALSNTEGRSRWSRLQSSRRSFCSGVPVRRSLLWKLKVFRSFVRRLSLSFMRCASSMMTYFHATLLSLLLSRMMNSYVVTRTLNLTCCTVLLKSCCLASFWPT
mmetsp:Transcript_16947/g.57892  ORF Transcript_16947/g.57892 Transcript_16947/m.57892 type:complete len:219 (-) Transcript_16947:449-1105(-)